MKFTPEMDAQLITLYAKPLTPQTIAAQANTWNCTSSLITKRAKFLKLSSQKTIRRWTTEEIILLRKMPHLTHQEASRALYKAGYFRTNLAISSFRFRDGWKISIQRDESVVGYSAETLATLMGIDGRTVQRWIRLKFLKAKKEGGSDQTRIGHYRIQPKHIQDFLKDYIHYVNLGKVDKYWLIDILTQKL